ncbi:MAG TPA: alpha/beta fold hydrolase [Aggregatilinea sp.]|uniref:alpha/beta fold hydrolase n=1 Tax=Aggregatilinea sp. TaxID=2806333 RepID=UPI002CFE9E57|nr:alpha/beta fold hydrolase [Aggregatilinea sp.]HML22962.1 alpha/beta fold hydrolase [Aggregatilinea sp.]
MPTLTANGVELYYELHGSSPEILILNNGVIANTKSWAAQVAALAPHMRVLVYDMRGQGQSQKWKPGDPDYTWEQHADDLAALMDALDIPAAHIGGISYGGELTQVFALRYPDRCQKLIIADAVSHVEPMLEGIVDSWARVAAFGDHETFYRSTWYWNYSEPFFAVRYEFLLSRIDAARGLDLPSVVQLCRCFLTMNTTPRLPEITQPTCVIVGEKDILKPPHYSETIAECIPNAELHVINGAGHASFLEQPEAFNQILLDFLVPD